MTTFARKNSKQFLYFIRELTEEGAHFRSHIDGSKHLFTPENVVDTQRIIGADIMMALDECTPGDADYDYAKKSLALTRRWLDRGWKHFCETEGLYGYKQTFFPIVQGCVYPDLRIEAAKHVADLGADGNAIDIRSSLRVERRKIIGPLFIPHIHDTVTGKQHTIAPIASRHHTVEHIDTSLYTFQYIGRWVNLRKKCMR